MNREMLRVPSPPNEQDPPAVSEGEFLDPELGAQMPDSEREVQPIALDACKVNCKHPMCANGCMFPRVGATACGIYILDIGRE